MNFILSSPSVEELVRLLRAWRFWVLGAIVGALLGTVIYYVALPPYRAQATVNVDFNLEQALSDATDRQQFYYLEREARKLEEIAWSDDLMATLSSEFAISVEELREKKLHLSQPADAGWHFYADDHNPQIAEGLASAWANAFVEKVQAEIAVGNANEFIKIEVTQSANLPKERRIPLANYLLSGSFGFLTLAIFVLLFTKPKTVSK